MKTLFMALVLTCLACAYAATPGQVVHPSPKEPRYIPINLLATFESKLDAPPKPQSPQQKSDEDELRKLQAERTPADCKRAEAEVFVSVGSFFGAPYGPLAQGQVEKLTPVFEQVRNDADAYIQPLKRSFPRQRPFLYVKGLTPCVPKEVTDAYPSGHATLARLYGLLLADAFPALKEKLLARADQIALDRVLSGMHHPSDIRTGKRLGELLYEQFKASKPFMQDYAKAQKSL